ncbi:hypothetical protein JXA29_08630, partial [Aerococcaceae bacterium zg-BR33]|nr:hypothetical protein [Aerococcaceae bacterium zg-BR33]
MARKKVLKYEDKFLDKLELIPEHKQEFARELIKEMSFMRTTLDGLQQSINDNGMLTLFKQGSQEFMREN